MKRSQRFSHLNPFPEGSVKSLKDFDLTDLNQKSPPNGYEYQTRLDSFHRYKKTSSVCLENVCRRSECEKYSESRKTLFKALNELFFIIVTPFEKLKIMPLMAYTRFIYEVDLNLFFECLVMMIRCCFKLRQFNDCETFCDIIISFFSERRMSEDSQIIFPPEVFSILAKRKLIERKFSLCRKYINDGFAIHPVNLDLKHVQDELTIAEEETNERNRKQFKELEKMLLPDDITPYEVHLKSWEKKNPMKISDHSSVSLSTTDITCSKQRYLTISKQVECLLFIKRHELLLVGSRDGSIRCIDYHTFKEVSVLRRHLSDVNHMILLNDRTMLSCDDDGKILGWDIKTRFIRHNRNIRLDYPGSMIFKMMRISDHVFLILRYTREMTHEMSIVDLNKRKTLARTNFDSGTSIKRICCIKTKPDHFITDLNETNLSVWKFDMIMKSNNNSIQQIREFCGPLKLIRHITTYIEESCGKEIIVASGEGKTIWFFDLESRSSVYRKVELKYPTSQFLIQDSSSYIISGMKCSRGHQNNNNKPILDVFSFKDPSGEIVIRKEMPRGIERSNNMKLLWTESDDTTKGKNGEFVVVCEHLVMKLHVKNLVPGKEDEDERIRWMKEYGFVERSDVISCKKIRFNSTGGLFVSSVNVSDVLLLKNEI